MAVSYHLILLSNSDICSVNVDNSMRLASDEPQPLKGDLSGLELASWLAAYSSMFLCMIHAWVDCNPPALISPVFKYSSLHL